MKNSLVPEVVHNTRFCHSVIISLYHIQINQIWYVKVTKVKLITIHSLLRSESRVKVILLKTGSPLILLF